MRAMILAAGRGQRMRPLTDHCPKPLLQVGGRALIEWHLRRLAAAGIKDVVVNHAWLGAQIEQALGDGAACGVRLRYSAEAPALETAAGIARALPLLGAEPFLVINGDVWCDWQPGAARALADSLPQRCTAHLLLVPNPAEHPQGDFWLAADGYLLDPKDSDHAAQKYTYSGIAVFRPEFFATLDPDTPAALAPLLRAAIERRQIRASLYTGVWADIGTPQRLEQLREALRANPAMAGISPQPM